MRRIGNHCEFYALQAIKPGRELTCDYGPTHHEGALPCSRGADTCRGFI
jgi:SET domain-containing protein